jgi:hypothetical protein
LALLSLKGNLCVQAPSLLVEVSCDGGEVQAGEALVSTCTVTNDGNVTIKGITVAADEDKKGLFKLESDVLSPGEATSGTHSHEVTQSELDAGVYKSTALASAVGPDGAEVAGSCSVEVKLKTVSVCVLVSFSRVVCVYPTSAVVSLS